MQVQLVTGNIIHLKSQIFHLLLYFFVSTDGLIDGSVVSNNSACKLWHFLRNGQCFCGTTEHGVVESDEHFTSIKQGSCVTYGTMRQVVQKFTTAYSPSGVITHV